MSCKSYIKARLIGAFVLIILLSGCVCCNGSGTSGQLVLQDHPLVNKIWDTKKQQFVSKEEMLKHGRISKYLLLGETHDNISHHRHQAEIIADLQHAQRITSVHFEMIDDEQAVQLRQSGYASADDLVQILSKSSPGWDYDKMYRVIFEQSLKTNSKILPANLPRDSIRTIFADGEKHIPDAVRNIMRNTELTVEQRKSMEKEIIEGHCNVMPDEMLEPMMLAQRVRDARMALSLIQGDAETRVLITGNGHARKDRGVPLYLKAEDNAGKIVSIAFIEVEDNHMQISEYGWRWDNNALPFDYIWFTPQFDRPDPCKGLEERLNRK